MGFVDLAMLEIRLGDGPPAGVGIGVFVPMDDEPTEGGPLGQQPLDRRRIGSLQLRLDLSSSCSIASWRENVFPGRFSINDSVGATRPMNRRPLGKLGPRSPSASKARTSGRQLSVSLVRPLQQPSISGPGAGGFAWRRSAASGFRVATSLISVSSAIGLCVCETRPQSSPRRPRPGRHRTIPPRPFPPSSNSSLSARRCISLGLSLRPILRLQE